MIQQLLKIISLFSSSLYILLLFAFALSGNKYFLIAASVICIVYVFLIRWRFEYFVFIVFFSVSILITSSFWNYLFYQPLYFFFISCVVGIFIYQNPPSKFWCGLVFILVASYFSFHILSFSDLNEDVFFGNSRNFISIWMIVVSIFCYASPLSRNVKIIIFSVSFIISSVTLGRSGIISTFFILLSYIFLSESKSKAKEFLFIISVMLVFLVSFFDEIYFLIETIVQRFEGARAVDPRALVLDCYIDNIDLFRFSFGVNAFDGEYCGTLAIGEYAPHNSLISLYANLGVMSIIYLIIALIMRAPLELKCIFFGLLLRASTDSVLFFTYFDFIYIYLLLKIYHAKRY